MFYIRDKAMNNHWVGNSIMKPIDVDEFFNKKVIICELESSLNEDAAIDASVVTNQE